MSRQTRLVITVAVCVALLAVAAWLLMPAAESGNPLVLRDSKASDINTASISNQYGTFNITAEDGGYVSDDIPPVILDIQEFYDLMTNCAAVSVKQVVDETPGDLALYGLDKPAATVDVVYNDDSELKFYIGDQERITGNYYCSVEGKSAVYLMEAQRCSAFLLPKKDFVEDVITPPLQMSSPFSAVRDVTFTGGPLDMPVTLKAVTGEDEEITRLAASFGAPTHLVMGKGIYELDQTYGIDLLNSLLGVTANNIEGYNLTPEQISAFGFDSPYMQVEFDLKNGVDAEVVHYSLALIEKGGLYYMSCNDNGVIYEVPKPLFADIQYSKLPVRWFLSPMITDITKVELATANETLVFEISGETKEDRAVTLNGQPFDIERFYKFYELITSAANDGNMYDNLQPQGNELLTITYYYKDAEKSPDVMKLFEGDTLRNCVQINGVTEFQMLDTYLERVRSVVKNIWGNEPIDTKW
ncbi:MAG: DUF4340 domain-containing protein [Burkholderiales bacterium]